MNAFAISERWSRDPEAPVLIDFRRAQLILVNEELQKHMALAAHNAFYIHQHPKFATFIGGAPPILVGAIVAAMNRGSTTPAAHVIFDSCVLEPSPIGSAPKADARTKEPPLYTRPPRGLPPV